MACDPVTHNENPIMTGNSPTSTGNEQTSTVAAKHVHYEWICVHGQPLSLGIASLPALYRTPGRGRRLGRPGAFTQDGVLRLRGTFAEVELIALARSPTRTVGCS